MTQTAARGRFVTFEGSEGAGKSTQVRMLVDALTNAGTAAIATREPGGSPAAEEVRALLVAGGADRWDPIAETLLHFAARREHLRTTIRPARARGIWVVCDRFADSTMAYQHYGQGVPRDAVEALRALVVGADDEPELTIVLNLPPEAGLARAARRAEAEARYEAMGLAFHRRVHAGFLEIAAAHPERCAVLDATGEPAAVHAAVRTLVRERLGARL